MPENIETKKETKFILRLSQIQSAVSKLPDPVTSEQNTCTVRQDGCDIEFEKVSIKKNGEKTYRWSYKGRIFVDLKYIENVGK